MKVGRKLGNAVVRNKIKRRTRHLVRTIFKSTATDCISIIVVPKKGFDKIPFSSLFKEFEKIYQLILGKKVDYSC
jgi:ribonuclease P protein component